jgi:hypothetical protein
MDVSISIQNVHLSHKKKGEALGKMPPLEQRKEKRG